MLSFVSADIFSREEGRDLLIVVNRLSKETGDKEKLCSDNSHLTSITFDKTYPQSDKTYPLWWR